MTLQQGGARWPWVLCFLALALAFWGVRPLWEPDEGRYGEAAREMAVGGDWVVPHLQGEPHLTKPPMTYWLAAAGLRLTGVGPGQPIGNAWGARLFVGPAFFGTMLCVVGIAGCWGWRRRAAWTSGLIFGTAILPFICGHLLTTDMLLTFWETLGMLCLWRVWSRRGNITVWRTGFWAAQGMAFLTKGPPGLLPLLAVAAFAALRKGRQGERVRSWGGPFLFLSIALPWFLAIEYRLPGTFTYFLRDEVVGRVMSDSHDRGKPFGFYFLVVPLGMLPWLHLWPPLVAGMWRRLKPEGEAPGFGPRLKSAWSHVRSLDDPALFSLIWFTLPMAVFFLSSSKMFLYVVPLLVPVSLWMGRLHDRQWPDGLPAAGWGRRAAIGVGAMWCLLLAAFSLLGKNSGVDRSLAVLADAVREAPLGSVPGVHVYGDTPDTISFYSGVRLLKRSEDLTTGPFMRMLMAEAARGGGYLLIDVDDADEMEKRGVAWREIARQHEWTFVQVQPRDESVPVPNEESFAN
jgi:4-amino-4-deoxy-L-arabinose transferase